MNKKPKKPAAPKAKKTVKPKMLYSIVTGYMIFSDGTGVVSIEDGRMFDYEPPNLPLRIGTPEFEAHLAKFIKL